MKGQEHPTLRDLPIGIDVTGQRHETDSMGGIDVPADRYWGAQTQRSLVHFAIGDDRMPKRVYHAYGYPRREACQHAARAKYSKRTLAGHADPTMNQLLHGHAVAGRRLRGHCVKAYRQTPLPSQEVAKMTGLWEPLGIHARACLAELCFGMK
jgi:hypothetical protein